MNLEIYQKLCAESKILWTQHCLQRMQERDISRADVKNGIATGEIIEDYPDDFPNPSCLMLLLFTPVSITPLIGMEDARFGLNASRPSSQTILNGEMRYCLQVTCEQ